MKEWIKDLTKEQVQNLTESVDPVEYSEIETGEDGICLGCKEHAEIIILLEDGEEVDRLSNCCGASIWTD